MQTHKQVALEELADDMADLAGYLEDRDHSERFGLTTRPTSGTCGFGKNAETELLLQLKFFFALQPAPSSLWGARTLMRALLSSLRLRCTPLPTH